MGGPECLQCGDGISSHRAEHFRSLCSFCYEEYQEEERLQAQRDELREAKTLEELKEFILHRLIT